MTFFRYSGQRDLADGDGRPFKSMIRSASSLAEGQHVSSKYSQSLSESSCQMESSQCAIDSMISDGMSSRPRGPGISVSVGGEEA